MTEILDLGAKIYPIYAIVVLGYIAGKYLHVQRESVAILAIYFAAPVVVFNSAATVEGQNDLLLLPVIFFATAVTISISFYFVGQAFWKGPERNLLASACGSGNTGYFGLPLVLALYGVRAQNVAILATLGLIVYENTWGYFMMARGHGDFATAIKNVAKLPALYAFGLGLVFHFASWTLPRPVADTIVYFRGAYVFLGMMIVGLGMATVTRATLDKTFTTLAFAAKFIAYPILTGLLIIVDNRVTHLFDLETHHVMLILSIVPMASNTVAFATRLRVHPEKAAFTVLLSNLFALFYIPAFISVFLK